MKNPWRKVRKEAPFVRRYSALQTVGKYQKRGSGRKFYIPHVGLVRTPLRTDANGARELVGFLKSVPRPAENAA